MEWGVPSDGTPTQGGSGGGRPSNEVVCYWVAIPTESVSQNPESWIDYGLELPPPGLDVVWQTVECSNGSRRYEFRWVVAITPENLASVARGRLVGLLAPPVVASNPPLGVSSIVGVPVFVEVTNWTGVRTESECAGGLCVTVTASPALWFAPGEPGSAGVTCAGAGSRFVPGVDLFEQAAAPGACAHTYRQRTATAGRPSAWPGVVAVTWDLTWSASDGTSGVLTPVTLTADVPRGVDEVQTVVVGGQGP
ncbi:MAG: hypothetical protein AMXMBFR46_27620 [Acidimicrobiia bacterium]